MKNFPIFDKFLPFLVSYLLCLKNFMVRFSNIFDCDTREGRLRFKWYTFSRAIFDKSNAYYFQESQTSLVELVRDYEGALDTFQVSFSNQFILLKVILKVRYCKKHLTWRPRYSCWVLFMFSGLKPSSK